MYVWYQIPQKYWDNDGAVKRQCCEVSYTIKNRMQEEGSTCLSKVDTDQPKQSMLLVGVYRISPFGLPHWVGRVHSCRTRSTPVVIAVLGQKWAMNLYSASSMVSFVGFHMGNLFYEGRWWEKGSWNEYHNLFILNWFYSCQPAH